MAEKTLNTRVQLKYDSYANWTSTTLGSNKGANFVLKAGEIGICYLPSGASENQVTGSQPPQVLFKVGDGISKFSALPWASAKAADVYAWAKKSESEFTTWVKTLISPSDINAYTKNEIDNKFTANSTADQKYAKDYADGLAKNYDAKGTAQSLINALDVTDTAVAGKYVSAVSEANGKISVTRADLPTLATGSENGTVAYNGTNVPVKGLGTAAFWTDDEIEDAFESVSMLVVESVGDTGFTGKATMTSLQVLQQAESGRDVVFRLDEGFLFRGLRATSSGEIVFGLLMNAKDNPESPDTYAYMEITLDTEGNYSVTSMTSFATTTTTDALDSKITNLNTEVANYKTSNNKALADEITRAKAAEAKALDDAKKYTDDVKKSILGEGISTTFDTLVEIQNWINGAGVNATELTEAIAVETQNRANADTRIEGLITSETNRATGEEQRLEGKIDANTAVLTGLGIANNKVATAVNAEKLGNVEASKYLKKEEAAGYSDILTKTKAQETYQPKGNYATSAQGEKADTALQSVTFAGKALTKSGTAASISQADARTALGLKSAAYTESSAYATSAQGTKADAALQSVAAGTGLKVSTKASNSQTIEFDDSVVFVFNCGDSQTVI